MRKIVTFCILFALWISIPGCVVVLGDRDFDDDVEVVEIDGEYYVKDDDTHRLHKVERSTTTQTETKTKSETKPGQP